MNLRIAPCFVFFVLFIQCGIAEKEETRNTIDYLEVGKMLKEIGAPRVVALKSENGKRLTIVGCPHSRDTASIEFDLIDIYFRHLSPDIAFNEGGPVADSIHFMSRNHAISKSGETGLLKFKCDQLGIKMLDGDFSAQDEFEVMLKRYPKEDLLLYYVFERFMIPYRYGFEGDKPIAEAYDHFISDYMMKHRFPLDGDEKTFTYLTSVYEKNLNQKFDITTADFSKFNFLTDEGKFGKIARVSKEIRDDKLMEKIKNAFQDHDRIFIVFGGAHVIAIEPALVDLMKELH